MTLKISLYSFCLYFSQSCEIYAHVTKRSTWGVFHLCGVTNHGDRCPSLMGVNWVSDGVSIDSGGIYAYRRCSLLMQRRVIDNSYLLMKKQSDSVCTGLFQLSNRLQVFLMEQEILWTFFCVFFVVIYLY